MLAVKRLALPCPLRLDCHNAETRGLGFVSVLSGDQAIYRATARLINLANDDVKAKTALMASFTAMDRAIIHSSSTELQ